MQRRVLVDLSRANTVTSSRRRERRREGGGDDAHSFFSSLSLSLSSIRLPPAKSCVRTNKCRRHPKKNVSLSLKTVRAKALAREFVSSLISFFLSFFFIISFMSNTKPQKKIKGRKRRRRRKEKENLILFTNF